MKKAFLILQIHLLVFSIYAEPNSMQDSLIKRFLRFVPDSIALESVWGTGYKDHEVEESWLLITKDVGAQDYEEAKDYKFWNTENEYCRDHGSRGFVVLFKYKSGEYYKVVEDYHCLDSGEEDGGVYYSPELDIHLYKEGILDISYSHGRYGNWGCSFKYIDGEFKYISSSSNESMSWIADYLSTSHIDFYEGIEKKSKIINASDVDDEDFYPRYIYHTYDATPTYLLSISEVVHEEGIVRDPDIEYVNYRLLKTEIDDYKIVDGEKQWYRREITEEEENEIEVQEW